MKITFAKIFKASTYSFKDAFDVFNASLFKVFVYFVFLNLLMLLPVTLQVANLDDFDYARFGMNFTTTEIPEWIPEGIPTSCVVENGYLDCGMDHIFEYELVDRDMTYNVYFNVPSDVTYNEDNTIVFYHHGINLNVKGNVLRLTYIGLEGVDFEDFEGMSQEEAADILFEGFYQSVKPVLILPIILMGVGVLFTANFFLVVMLATISMLFSFNQSEFPKYKNIIKLMMIASTIPAIVNLVLGFMGLSAFTSLTYNFVTPILAFFMYRASRRKLMINS
jgi:maltodextrin utilization protein YvdJ